MSANSPDEVDLEEFLAFWRGAVKPDRVTAFGLDERDVRMTLAGVCRLLAEIDRLKAGGSVTDPKTAAVAFIMSQRLRGSSWEGVRALFAEIVAEMS